MRQVFSSSCFIYCEQRVLLVHHQLLDLWLPVGGEIESKEVTLNKGTIEEQYERTFESPQEAAYREALEETGFEVEFRHKGRQPHGTPAGFLGYEEHSAGPKGQHMNFCFLGFAVRTMYNGKLEPIRPGGHPHPKSDGSWNGFSWVIPGDPQSYETLRMPPNVRDCLFLIDALLKQ